MPYHCCRDHKGKQRHDGPAEAEACRARLIAIERHPSRARRLNIFKCDECGKWFVGHLNPKLFRSLMHDFESHPSQRLSVKKPSQNPSKN